MHDANSVPDREILIFNTSIPVKVINRTFFGLLVLWAIFFSRFIFSSYQRDTRISLRVPAPKKEEEKKTTSTTSTTKNRRRTKYTTINNHFAANAINIYTDNPLERITSTSQQHRPISATDSADCDSSLNSSPPRTTNATTTFPFDDDEEEEEEDEDEDEDDDEEEGPTISITFRTSDNSLRDIIQTFPMNARVGDLFAWVESVPCPFEGKEGMGFSLELLRGEELGGARDLQGVKGWNVEELGLDGGVVLVEFEDE